MKRNIYPKLPLIITFFVCCLASGNVYSQYSDKGITLSFGIMGAAPLGDAFTTTHTVGAGPISSLIVPLSFKGDFTATLKATSFLGKPVPSKTTFYKHKNVMYFLAGYRHNFNPDLASAFYIEPRVGYALIGTRNQAICYEPVLGYYFNEKLDVNVWFQNSVTTDDYERIGAIGVTVNLSFHNLFKFLNYY